VRGYKKFFPRLAFLDATGASDISMNIKTRMLQTTEDYLFYYAGDQHLLSDYNTVQWRVWRKLIAEVSIVDRSRSAAASYRKLAATIQRIDRERPRDERMRRDFWNTLKTYMLKDDASFEAEVKRYQADVKTHEGELAKTREERETRREAIEEIGKRYWLLAYAGIGLISGTFAAMMAHEMGGSGSMVWVALAMIAWPIYDFFWGIGAVLSYLFGSTDTNDIIVQKWFFGAFASASLFFGLLYGVVLHKMRRMRSEQRRQ
jgi:hypothetical protein